MGVVVLLAGLLTAFASFSCWAIRAFTPVCVWGGGAGSSNSGGG